MANAPVRVPKGVNAGSMKNNVSNKTTSQVGSGGMSASQGTATGSGSRPGKGKYPIDSTNPSHSQMIRPKNKIEGTGYKG